MYLLRPLTSAPVPNLDLRWVYDRILKHMVDQNSAPDTPVKGPAPKLTIANELLNLGTGFRPYAPSVSVR